MYEAILKLEKQGRKESASLRQRKDFGRWRPTD